jgi:sarcosine oxidase delta subunit
MLRLVNRPTGQGHAQQRRNLAPAGATSQTVQPVEKRPAERGRLLHNRSSRPGAASEAWRQVAACTRSFASACHAWPAEGTPA